MLTRYVSNMAKLGVSDDLFNFTGVFDELFSSLRPAQDVLARCVESAGLRSYRASPDKDGLTLEVDLPGIALGDISLWADDKQLIIKVAKGDQKFTNRYTISNEYDVSTAKATMVHGQLTIRLAKAANQSMKRIDVTQG